MPEGKWIYVNGGERAHLSWLTETLISIRDERTIKEVRDAFADHANLCASLANRPGLSEEEAEALDAMADYDDLDPCSLLPDQGTVERAQAKLRNPLPPGEEDR